MRMTFPHRYAGHIAAAALASSADPIGFAFAGAGRVLVADAGDFGNNIPGEAQLYSYPAGSFEKSYVTPNGGVPMGAGVYPTEQF